MPTTSVKTLRYFRDQFGGIAWLGVLSLISAQFQAAALILIVPLGNAIAEGKRRYHGHLGPIQIHSSTGHIAMVAAGAVLVAATLDIWSAWDRSRIMTKWEYRLREQTVAEFLGSDYETQAAERLGTLGTLSGYVTRGTTALGALVSGLSAGVTILVFVFIAFLIDYRSALFLIGIVLVLSLLLRPVMSRTKKYSRAMSRMLVDYGREVTEATRMARDIRVFDATGPVGARLTRISASVARVREKSAFVSGVTSPVYQYTALLLIVGGLGVAQGIGTSDVAQFGAIALLLLRSMTFGQQIQNAYQTLLDCMPYVERLEEMRAIYTSHPAPDGTVPLERIHTLDFDQVRFSYDGEVEALAGVSASFPVGEIVGIVGPSGGGKSTLSQIVLRLRVPTAGSLTCNGEPASQYTLSSWYRHVSLVPQDPRLFHATVAENIAFLDPTISRDDVIEAAKAAGVHEVVETLDHKYDTLIGPAFRDLSGGQIQRIGIARALARGAEILVLDEPTSALDVHSEQVIQQTLEALRGRVLVMIIAHRLSTLSICDRILVLQAGKVETMGTLSEVSERSDFFRRALDAGTLEIGVGGTPPIVSPDDV
ncbi:MAG TPA: ABC transporter ATP-binding protein [Acidimicrobiia bacterium]|nr:ABC transporter ATP-binding protein [Acidimicrobiia bacterium]